MGRLKAPCAVSHTFPSRVPAPTQFVRTSAVGASRSKPPNIRCISVFEPPKTVRDLSAECKASVKLAVYCCSWVYCGTANMQTNRKSEDGRVRLLVIDDDKKLCRLLKDYLEPMGYTVELAHTGPEGAEQAIAEEWGAIVLDVMLPGLDGFEVLKKIRAHSTVPVLMLTARGEEPDRIVGLEMGADDYLPKTFSPRELLARLRAVTRRTTNSIDPKQETETEFVVGSLRINVAARVAVLDDEPLSLTAVEFDLLHSLARARGRIKTREQLLEEIRERDYDVFDRSIDVHISALRKKLGDQAKEPRFIKTVRSIGYMFLKPGTSE